MSGDNRPPFPDAPDRQSTAVRKLLSEEPQTASEIAACFQGGELNIRDVLEVLELEQVQARAALSERGWTHHEAASAARPPRRAMQTWRIDALNAHYEKHSKLDADMTQRDWIELASLMVELSHRNRPRAIKLRRRIADRLAVSGALPRLTPELLSAFRAEVSVLSEADRAEAQAQLFEDLQRGTGQLPLPDPEDEGGV